MATRSSKPIRDGAACVGVRGTHAGKAGTAHDINTSKTGAVTLTIRQKDGTRFKTLATNVEVQE